MSGSPATADNRFAEATMSTQTEIQAALDVEDGVPIVRIHQEGERLLTIPLKTVLDGGPHLEHLRAALAEKVPTEYAQHVAMIQPETDPSSAPDMPKPLATAPAQRKRPVKPWADQSHTIHPRDAKYVDGGTISPTLAGRGVALLETAEGKQLWLKESDGHIEMLPLAAVESRAREGSSVARAILEKAGPVQVSGFAGFGALLNERIGESLPTEGYDAEFSRQLEREREAKVGESLDKITGEYPKQPVPSTARPDDARVPKDRFADTPPAYKVRGDASAFPMVAQRLSTGIMDSKGGWEYRIDGDNIIAKKMEDGSEFTLHKSLLRPGATGRDARAARAIVQELRSGPGAQADMVAEQLGLGYQELAAIEKASAADAASRSKTDSTTLGQTRKPKVKKAPPPKAGTKPAKPAVSTQPRAIEMARRAREPENTAAESSKAPEQWTEDEKVAAWNDLMAPADRDPWKSGKALNPTIAAAWDAAIDRVRDPDYESPAAKRRIEMARRARATDL